MGGEKMSTEAQNMADLPGEGPATIDKLQNAGFQNDLNARENIIMNGMLLGLSKNQIESKVDSVMEYAELEKFSNMQLKHYSSGMRARLAFATAMQINPDILLVDEILSVGDKDFRKKKLRVISFI